MEHNLKRKIVQNEPYRKIIKINTFQNRAYKMRNTMRILMCDKYLLNIHSLHWNVGFNMLPLCFIHSFYINTMQGCTSV